MRSIANNQNWFHDGDEWYNFHDYLYYHGSKLTVVRGPLKKKGRTRKVLGKYRQTANGMIDSLKKGDSKYADEDPSTWWSPVKLKEFRDMLEGNL